MKKIIGFDIDGVLTTSDGRPWEEELIAYFQLARIEDPEKKDMQTRYGLTREQMDEFFSIRSHFVFPRLTMREGANTFLQELKALDFTIILITARTNSPETPKWLKANQIPYDLLVHSHDKLPPCLEHDVQLFIEDNFGNAASVASAGIPALLMDTDYNRMEILPHGVHRVHDYAEVREYILGQELYLRRQVG